MAGNRQLNKAKKDKNDEFYTQLRDIENELYNYRDHFKGKIIYCNCDDPYESNFFKYFAMNFNFLELKRLIATSYNGSPIIGNELPIYYPDQPVNNKKAYKIIINEVKDYTEKGYCDLSDVEWLIQNKANIMCELEENGDFRSRECTELLKTADIVVTNPPFSLFREYIAQLMEYDKKFVIVGNQNAITYKEIFPLLRDNKIWLGVINGDYSFKVPEDYPPMPTRYWVDEEGQKWRSMGNICWFTNLDIKKRHEKIDFVFKYIEKEYPKYDNYNAINIDRIVRIPDDYYDIMGVPITFFDKYNPNQFEIIGLIASAGYDPKIVNIPKIKDGDARPIINNKVLFPRILIKRKK